MHTGGGVRWDVNWTGSRQMCLWWPNFRAGHAIVFITQGVGATGPEVEKDWVVQDSVGSKGV